MGWHERRVKQALSSQKLDWYHLHHFDLKGVEFLKSISPRITGRTPGLKASHPTPQKPGAWLLVIAGRRTQIFCGCLNECDLNPRPAASSVWKRISQANCDHQS